MVSLMKKIQQTIVLALFGFGCSLVSFAANYYVSPVGSADPNGSAAKPYATIQAALDAAQNGDTIILLSGLYTGIGNRNLTPVRTNLTIRSTNPADPAITEQTIIDPNQLGYAFFLNNQSAGLALEGLTIQNGKNLQTPFGGAIYCDSVSPAIRHCRFINCRVDGQGGAIYCQNSSPVIQHCIFVGNAASGGGAICALEGSIPTIINSTIAGNQGNFYGGGLFCDLGSSAVVRNCIFWDNHLEYSGNGGQQITIYGGTLTLSYSDIQGGISGIDKDDSTVINGQQNIDQDPLFVSLDSQLPASQWDMRLQSQYGRWNNASLSWTLDAQTSPCIDSADAATDWSLEPWPNGKRANMGAYGGTIQASMNGNKADFDISGTVDMLDFAAFCDNWLSSADVVMDFDDSGLVDLADFAEFAKNWLWGVNVADNEADFDKNGIVNMVDFSIFSKNWLSQGDVVMDFDDSGLVDISDLIVFAQNWLWIKP